MKDYLEQVSIFLIMAVAATTSVFFMSRCQEVKLVVTCDANVARCEEIIKEVYEGKK